MICFKINDVNTLKKEKINPFRKETTRGNTCSIIALTYNWHY